MRIPLSRSRRRTSRTAVWQRLQPQRSPRVDGPYASDLRQADRAAPADPPRFHTRCISPGDQLLTSTVYFIYAGVRESNQVFNLI